MEKIIKMYNEYIKLAEKRISFLENEISSGKDCEGEDQKDLDNNHKHLASFKRDLAELETNHKKEIVGHYEVAKILGWQKQQVAVYISRGKFPEPLQKLASGPIWLKEDIEKFKESRGKMKIMYEEILVGEVMTNKSMTVDEALEMISFDEEKFLQENGFDAIDYNDFKLVY